MTRSLILFVASSAVLWASLKLVLYKFGIEILGAWGMISTLANLLKLFDLGQGMLTLTAISNLQSLSKTRLSSLLSTALLKSLAATSGASVIAFLLIITLHSEVFIGITPLMILKNHLFILLAGTLLGGAGQIVGSALDGSRRGDLRNLATLLGQATFTIAIFLGPKTDPFLKTIPYAYSCQALVTFLSGMFFFKSLISLYPAESSDKPDPLLPIPKASTDLQIMNLIGPIGDIGIRMILQRFCGLTVLGYYELSQKLIGQVRSILTTAYQASISFIFLDSDPSGSATLDKEERIYFKLLAKLTLAIVLGSLPASFIFFGEIQFDWIRFFVILSIGLMVSAISIPHYFMLIMKNRSRDLLNISLQTNLSILLISLALGFAGFPNGIIIAASGMHALGGIRIYRRYLKILSHIR